MYLRLLKLSVLEEKLPEFRQFYDQRVFPALAEIDGCDFATLLQKSFAPEECVSLTVWRNQEKCHAYERGRLFRDLVRESEGFVASRSEWRVRTDAALEEETADLLPAPPVSTYSAGEENHEAIESAARDGGHGPHLRIVAVQVKPGKMEEFRRAYYERIAPALTEEVTGCRGVFLAESTDESSASLSVTVWKREEDAVRYEMSGKFDELTQSVHHLYEGVFQWSLALEHGFDVGEARRSLGVKGYEVVSGGRL